MLKAELIPYKLKFAFTARTSRETFREKLTYFIKITDGNKSGIGEIAFFPSLQPSFSNLKNFERELNDIVENINDFISGYLPENSAIRFGLETAFGDLENGGNHAPFGENSWSKGERFFLINGLIWMNEIPTMEKQIADKIEKGYTCLKLKIGANNFEKEIELLKNIRSSFPNDRLEIRLDANGCFNQQNVMECLNRLSAFDIHSVEQPLPRDSEEMAEIIKTSPIAVALDEDMIERWWSIERKAEWLERLHPQYIIIKPSLIGGFMQADEWIDVASKLNIGWWATSALESNIGLNAITQWLAVRNDAWNMRHGLGTGQIYKNNIESPIYLNGEALYYDSNKDWQAL